MFVHEHLAEATYADLKEARRFLTRILSDMLLASSVDLMPIMEIEYRLPKWDREQRGQESITVYGRVISMSRSVITIRDRAVRGQHTVTIPLKSIIAVNGEMAPPIESRTPRSLGLRGFE